MMQTLLTPTSPLIGGDKSAAPALARPADGAVQDGDKADFSELMSQYRHGGEAALTKAHAKGAKEGEAAQPDADTLVEPGALSPAAGRQEADAVPVASDGQPYDADGEHTPVHLGDEASVIMAGNPFLVHLHDSLNQDTRLVARGDAASAGEGSDGNSLPPAALAAGGKGDVRGSGEAADAIPDTPLDQDGDADEAVKQTQGAREIHTSALLAAAGSHEALAGDASEASGARPDTRPGGTVAAVPLTDKEPEQLSTRDQIPVMGPKSAADAAASTPADAYAAGNRVARQEGQEQPAADEAKSLTQTDAGLRQEAQGKERTAPQGAAQSPTAAGTSPTAAGTSPAVAPTLVAPQQVLAQAQSQGSQAPLASLPQGGAAVAIDGAAPQIQKGAQLGARGKLAGLIRGETQVATAPKREEEAQVAGQQPTQAAAGETRFGTAPIGQPRGEAPSLPHLKLAGQDAPAELQQRVNVMLADKLQQAEIQLDPLGLGKMKIQIQLGQDNQASVNFVVQHGQTREMLEQAMPRLREMLAGQGLSLGQTSVQQQSQQHSQPGSQQQAQGGGFSEQGGQGQGGEGRQPGRHEGETAVTRLTLSMDAANESGIDFYA